jgi:hypothetical protein
MNPTAAEVYGDFYDRLIANLYDNYADYVKHQRALMRDADWYAIKEMMPVNDEGGVDADLLHALAMDYVRPRFVYVNQRFWEDAPDKLKLHVAMLDLKPITGKSIPELTFLLSRTEAPVSEVASHLRTEKRRIVA